MARIRTIKPGFFRHADLYDAEVETGLPLRIAFAGLWCCADREGRFRWNPRELKLDALPHDAVDFARVLDALTTRGFIVRYETPSGVFGAIPSWSKHQVINNREAASELPPPPSSEGEIKQNQTVANASSTRAPRVEHANAKPLCPAQGEGEQEGEGNRKGREKICAEPLTRSPPKPPPKPVSPPFIELETNENEVFHLVTEAEVEQFAALYPAVDVRQQLRAIKGWLINNRAKRKTRSGMPRFINSWLSREQDKGQNYGAATSRLIRGAPANRSFADTLASLDGEGAEELAGGVGYGDPEPHHRRNPLVDRSGAIEVRSDPDEEGLPGRAQAIRAGSAAGEHEP
jgi:hypothetical protein